MSQRTMELNNKYCTMKKKILRDHVTKGCLKKSWMKNSYLIFEIRNLVKRNLPDEISYGSPPAVMGRGDLSEILLLIGPGAVGVCWFRRETGRGRETGSWGSDVGGGGNTWGTRERALTAEGEGGGGIVVLGGLGGMRGATDECVEFCKQERKQ